MFSLKIVGKGAIELMPNATVYHLWLRVYQTLHGTEIIISGAGAIDTIVEKDTYDSYQVGDVLCQK